MSQVIFCNTGGSTWQNTTNSTYDHGWKAATSSSVPSTTATHIGCSCWCSHAGTAGVFLRSLAHQPAIHHNKDAFLLRWYLCRHRSAGHPGMNETHTRYVSQRCSALAICTAVWYINTTVYMATSRNTLKAGIPAVALCTPVTWTCIDTAIYIFICIYICLWSVIVQLSVNTHVPTRSYTCTLAECN